MSAQYINYGNFDHWEERIKGRNDKLLERLHKIQTLIQSLQGEWESDAAEAIREKIQGMEPKFTDYYNVVDNYKIFVKNTGMDAETIEKTNTANAKQFI